MKVFLAIVANAGRVRQRYGIVKFVNLSRESLYTKIKLRFWGVSMQHQIAAAQAIEQRAKKCIVEYTDVWWLETDVFQFHDEAGVLSIQFDQDREQRVLSRMVPICNAVTGISLVKEVHLYCRGTVRVYKLSPADLINSASFSLNCL